MEAIMNSFTLLASITQEPQLRYTSDNQTPVAEMLVQLAGLQEDAPPETLKVVSWNALAQEIQTNYHQGDRVILEGYLTMKSIDRPEGFKEKVAEMTVQRIHHIDGGAVAPTPTPTPTPVARSAAPAPAPTSVARSAAPAPAPTSVARPSTSKSRKSKTSEVPVSASAPSVATVPEADYDAIPF
jgi:single-stranded DNA-binding protein